MEQALGWIGQLADWLLALIPRLIIVRSTHGGVKFVHGKHVKPLEPGLHIYWPLVTEISIIPTKRQTTDFRVQYLLPKDFPFPFSIAVSGVLIYEIQDATLALTECWDYEDTIQDMALAAIKDIVSQSTLEDLTNPETDYALEETLGPELEAFGIKPIRITLSDISPQIGIGLNGSERTVEQLPET